jgi:hypothetical protein
MVQRVEETDVVQDGNQWWVTVNTVTNFFLFYKTRSELTE